MGLVTVLPERVISFPGDMVRELVKQVLTLVMALLGALLGVTLGTWFIPDQQLDRWAWVWVIVLALVSLGLIVYLIGEAWRIDRRVSVVGRTIHLALDRAAKLEYDYRDGKYSSLQIGPAVEEWGDKVDLYLRRALPGSGADIRFRTGIGEVEAGHAYEHTRLKDLKSNLVGILDALPSYVVRSSLSKRPLHRERA